LSLYLTKKNAEKIYGGVVEKAPRVLNLGVGDLSASRHGRFNPRRKNYGIHWTGGWVSPRGDLDVVAKRQISVPAGRKSNLGRPTSSLVTILTRKLYEALVKVS
jgi:hypothetical protein